MAFIEIDKGSGFCFGVTTAINKAEEELSHSQSLYCLGDIVHNNAEVDRLRAKGLITIGHSHLADLRDVKILLRAHGEPPSTYATARANGITVIDATCPVVLRLQQRVKEAYDRSARDGHNLQILIYGQQGHAEVNGLVGQTDGTAIVIESADQLDKVDFTRDIVLYSQTTKSLEGFQMIIEEIERRLAPGVRFEHFDTICRQVANRVADLKKFAAAHEVILFVAGAKSSNGRILFNHCLGVNPHSHLVGGVADIDARWLREATSVGICGATSTPRWLMEQIASHARAITDGLLSDPVETQS